MYSSRNVKSSKKTIYELIQFANFSHTVRDLNSSKMRNKKHLDSSRTVELQFTNYTKLVRELYIYIVRTVHMQPHFANGTYTKRALSPLTTSPTHTSLFAQFAFVLWHRELHTYAKRELSLRRRRRFSSRRRTLPTVDTHCDTARASPIREL